MPTHTLPDIWLWVPPAAGDPAQFGTVINEHEDGWTLVDPLSERATKLAIHAGAEVVPADWTIR